MIWLLRLVNSIFLVRGRLLQDHAGANTFHFLKALSCNYVTLRRVHELDLLFDEDKRQWVAEGDCADVRHPVSDAPPT